MLRIITERPEAESELRRIMNRTQSDGVPEQEASVRTILNRVRQEGDGALLHYTKEFDGQTLTASQLRVTGSELDAAYQQIPKQLLDAIQLAVKQVEAFHRQRVPKSWVNFGKDGVVLGKRYTAVDRAGIYIPGGRGAYPSTAIMNAVPAKVAGVKEIVMVTPPGKDLRVDPAVLVAAQEAGVQEIYRVGGAQAIGALAYGSETITPVDVITGPGNIYVTLAKKNGLWDRRD